MRSLRFSLYFFILLISLNNFTEEENISLSTIDCDNTEFESTEPIYAETEEEKIRRLEKELEQALAQFDNCIVEESKSLEESGGGAAAASASTTASGENESENLKESSSTPSTSIMSDGDINLEESNSRQLSSSNGSIPKDVALINDDDIVATQLRELAMSEEDPNLRDQLWDKYREYKGIKKGDKNE
jgi:hypothetical protein|tara:strand:+ start:897 stop:1460 length:564 start_codon:yes stop_codon:yes gene_type:complete